MIHKYKRLTAQINTVSNWRYENNIITQMLANAVLHVYQYNSGYFLELDQKRACFASKIAMPWWIIVRIIPINMNVVWVNHQIYAYNTHAKTLWRNNHHIMSALVVGYDSLFHHVFA